MVEIGLETVDHIVIMLLLSTFFAAVGIFLIDGTSNDPANHVFAFNYKNWDKVPVSETVLGIITTSSAIVAIGFSINHITFSKVFETYSSRSFKFFFDQQKLFKSFIALILLIIFSTMYLLLFGGLVEPLQFLFLIILVFGLIYSLRLFYVTFHKTFRLLNKFEIIDELKNMIIHDMENLENDR